MARKPRHLLGLMLFLLVLATSDQVLSKMYRWVDSDGRVHYSDRVPPEHKRHARSRLDNQGITVERVDAAKTEDEIKREQELERLRAEKERLIENQRAADRVLLRTFRSEDDILMTRDGKLTTIDTSIQIVRVNIRRLKLNLANMQANAANLERQGQRISKRYIRDIESIRQQLKDNYKVIIHKEQDKEAIRERHAADLTRFRELKRLNPEPIENTSSNKIRSLLETVVICETEKDCGHAWSLAEEYVKTHATTRMQLLASSIIMTAAPIKDDDISITVSRILVAGEPGAQLFMDLQCKDSPRGRDLCKTERIDKIRAGFRPYVQSSGKDNAELSSAH